MTCLPSCRSLRTGTRGSRRDAPHRPACGPRCNSPCRRMSTACAEGCSAIRGRDVARQALHVLAVLDDRHPLAVHVGRDAVEALQHLVAFDGQAAGTGVEIRKYRAPNRVDVQDGPGAVEAGNREVDGRLSRRPRAAGRVPASRTGDPALPRWRGCPRRCRRPLCAPLRVIASRSGRLDNTTLKLPLVPAVQPRDVESAAQSRRAPARQRYAATVADGMDVMLHRRPQIPYSIISPSPNPITSNLRYIPLHRYHLLHTPFIRPPPPRLARLAHHRPRC